MVQCTYAFNVARADFVHLVCNRGALLIRSNYLKPPISFSTTVARDRAQRVNNAWQRKCNEKKLEETHVNDSCGGGCAQMEEQ